MSIHVRYGRFIEFWRFRYAFLEFWYVSFDKKRGKSLMQEVHMKAMNKSDFTSTLH